MTKILHKIFPQKCTKDIVLENNSITCRWCGTYIGSIYDDRVILLSRYKQYAEEIKRSKAVQEYTKHRVEMGISEDREWECFLRDLKFDANEVLPLETTDEWVPEDCEWGNTAGC